MEQSNSIIMINVSGPDKTGITVSLTQILASYNSIILDMGQSVIHKHFSLGFLIQLERENSSSMMKDFLFRAYSFGLQVTFTPIETQQYEEWKNEEVNKVFFLIRFKFSKLIKGKSRHFVTLLGRRITSEEIFKVTEIISHYYLNIDIVNRLSGRPSLLQVRTFWFE